MANIMCATAAVMTGTMEMGGWRHTRSTQGHFQRTWSIPVHAFVTDLPFRIMLVALLQQARGNVQASTTGGEGCRYCERGEN